MSSMHASLPAHTRPGSYPPRRAHAPLSAHLRSSRLDLPWATGVASWQASPHAACARQLTSGQPGRVQIQPQVVPLTLQKVSTCADVSH